jgi:hypothetical protein
MNAPPDASNSSAPLKLEFHIDATSYAETTIALEALCYQQLVTKRAASILRLTSTSGVATRRKWVQGLCIAGLIVTVGTALVYHVFYHAGLEETWFLFAEMLICAALLLCSFRMKPRPVSEPWPSLWHFFARVRLRTLLPRGRDSAPFDAHYVFDAESVWYRRIKDGKVVLTWSRVLTGSRLSGHGFTLLYKTPAAREPYAILLHPPCAQLDAWLDRLGVVPLVPHA